MLDFGRALTQQMKNYFIFSVVRFHKSSSGLVFQMHLSLVT